MWNQSGQFGATIYEPSSGPCIDSKLSPDIALKLPINTLSPLLNYLSCVDLSFLGSSLRKSNSFAQFWQHWWYISGCLYQNSGHFQCCQMCPKIPAPTCGVTWWILLHPWCCSTICKEYYNVDKTCYYFSDICIS